MNANAMIKEFGAMNDATLTIERTLPGPIERVWAYLTESDLRRKWLASGDMPEKVGTRFEMVWRNDELTSPPGTRPQGFEAESKGTFELIALEPPHKLAFTWENVGEVTIELKEKGRDVLLTLVHKRLPPGEIRANVSAGWHTHLDILVARVGEQRSQPFWEQWGELKREYARRLEI